LSIFKVPYKKIFDEVLNNQEHRLFFFETDNPEQRVSAEWFSYYVDREHVFGLVLHDPDHLENMVAFSATKPDENDEALINFRIQLPAASSPIDRNTMQMSFMMQALKLCDALGIKKFHYAEHVDLVDQDDTVIGLIPRSLAHESNEYVHRAASVMLWRWHFDEGEKQYKKELFMIHRSSNKQMNPDVWQAAPSGHLLPGETYAEAARRELGEEIGAKIASTVRTIYPLRQLRVYSDASVSHTPQKENFYFFIANIDYDASRFVNTNYESDVATWMDIDTIKRMMREDPAQFRDAFRMAFEKMDWDTVPGPGTPEHI
jgi:isopentenyldiphosphate isomerase